MPDPFPARGSVAGRSSPFLPHLPPRPNPLTSSWIRRLHVTPPPPPAQTLPLPRRHPPQGTASTTELPTLPPPPPPRRLAPPWREAEEAQVHGVTGFGPFQWSPAQRGPAAGGPQKLSPFFRLGPPAATPPGGWVDGGAASSLGFVNAPAGIGNGSAGRAAKVSRSVLQPGDLPTAGWRTPRASGAPYHGHVAETAPIRASYDLRDIRYGVTQQHIPRQAPSFSSQHDEPFSYWNMGRFGRNTTTSVPLTAAAHGNLGRKRNASFLHIPQHKLRKVNGAI